MIHDRETSLSYQEFLEFLHHEMNESVPKAFGSDEAKSIVNVISLVFPSSVQLVCTRRVRKNIERYLNKSKVIIVYCSVSSSRKQKKNWKNVWIF